MTKNDDLSHDDQAESPSVDREVTVDDNDYNPYQPSKTSFEEDTSYQASLKSLAVRFCWAYVLWYISFFITMICTLIVSNGALLVFTIWLLAFSFVVIPYIAYRRCLSTVPYEVSPSLRSQFKATSVVLAIALPFVVSILFFGLCAVIFY